MPSRKRAALLLRAFLSVLTWLCVQAREANFTEIFSPPPPKQEFIPKVAHFVFSKVRPLAWLEYASIRSSIVNLGVEKVNIWVPPESQFEGSIWQIVLAFPELVVREVEMPTSIYGNPVNNLAHVSDVVRLEAIYREGGIYMDYNLIALRSSDSVIYDASTESTVMAWQSDWGLCNALIMSKAGAPFLRRWMTTYQDFRDENWDGFSVRMPANLYKEDPSDLTALAKSTWFNPSWDDFDPGIDKLWFGKSFVDIDTNFGVHQWGGHDRTGSFLTPESVREIDTPFFCRIRNLFDAIGDGYVTRDWRSNPNCSAVSMHTLAKHPQRLMAAYDFNYDTPQKWVDASGNRLHGWSPYATTLLHDDAGHDDNYDSITGREFGQDSFAVLPIPTDYDTRVGALATELQLLKIPHKGSPAITLAHLRLNLRSSLQIRFRCCDEIDSDMVVIEVAWNAHDNAANSFVLASTPLPSTIFSNIAYHKLLVTWDRKTLGRVAVAIDDTPVLVSGVSTLPSPVIGQELWLNAVREAQVDMNLRARMRFLRIYGMWQFPQLQQLPDDNIGLSPSRSSKPAAQMFLVGLARAFGFSSASAFFAWASAILVAVACTATLVLRVWSSRANWRRRMPYIPLSADDGGVEAHSDIEALDERQPLQAAGDGSQVDGKEEAYRDA